MRRAIGIQGEVHPGRVQDMDEEEGENEDSASLHTSSLLKNCK